MSDYFLSLEYILVKHMFRGQYGYHALEDALAIIRGHRDEENQ